MNLDPSSGIILDAGEHRFKPGPLLILLSPGSPPYLGSYSFALSGVKSSSPLEASWASLLVQSAHMMPSREWRWDPSSSPPADKRKFRLTKALLLFPTSNRRCYRLLTSP